MDDLSTNIAAFCRFLRDEHAFSTGHSEAHDALRALEAVGVEERSRVRAALRLVCCGSPDQIAVFDRAFDSFFLDPDRGLPQPAYHPRHTRPGRERPDRPMPPAPADDASMSAGGGTLLERQPAGDAPDDATAWQILRARYSPDAARPVAPPLVADRDAAMLAAAAHVIAGVQLGRSRRWRAVERGRRLDLRRTMRASLQTGGDPVDLRRRGHPLQPRFVVLIDGSRSMSDRSSAIVAFARALCVCSSRTSVFVFSTALRNVTRELRSAHGENAHLASLGDAWGGGTKIGASLITFLAEHGARSLSPDTVFVIHSDGLDVGETDKLERAMREIHRRSAGVVWLNPHAGAAAYAPTARGMRAALPYVTLLAAANDSRGFEALARRLAQTTRFRGR